MTFDKSLNKIMKPSELHSYWCSPDNSRVTNKQYSFRLPIHVAAKLAALVDMYPQKTRTELVGDLLATALDDLIASLPSHKGRSLGYIPEVGEEVFEEFGPRVKFWELAESHFVALEREMGNDNPVPLRGSPQKSIELDIE